MAESDPTEPGPNPSAHPLPPRSVGAGRRAPRFWRRLLREARAHALWRDRLVVLMHAAATGLLIVAFTLLGEAAQGVFLRAVWGAAAVAPFDGAAGPWISLLWTPLVTVVVVAWMRRFVPGAAGSGIPQVVRVLEGDVPDAQRAALVSLRVSLHKVALVSAGLLGGLSIGREGPAVQTGAGVMVQADRWLSRRTVIDEHDLMVAGAAAGIAAAFNTPLGGIVFALEGLSRRRSMSHSTLVIASIVLAGLVAMAVFGNATYFGRVNLAAPTRDLLMPGLVLGLAAGLAGGLFARLIVVSMRDQPGRLGAWRQRHPLRFAAGCGLVVAIIGLVSGGATVGGGHAPTHHLLAGGESPAPLYTLLKFCATWLSAWSGVPAGLFAPSLSIGAGLGADVAQAFALDAGAQGALVAMGMAAFLAAATQQPITAFIIVMEMVGAHDMVLALMACVLLATAVSHLLTRPLYLELAPMFGPPMAPPAAAELSAAQGPVPAPADPASPAPGIPPPRCRPPPPT